LVAFWGSDEASFDPLSSGPASPEGGILVRPHHLLLRNSNATYSVVPMLFRGCDILALMDGDILAQGSIELIEYSYHQGASFSEAYLERTSKLSVLGLE
jgi:hypothetical protein